MTAQQRSEVETRPTSDVSVAVGLTGLAGLGCWILVCHFWPEVSATLDLPGPRGRLTGPLAGFGGLVAATLPMMAWSLLVERVHRRSSTGIDWDKPRKLRDVAEVSITKLAGLWVTWAVIGLFYYVGRWYWDGPYLVAMRMLSFAIVPLMVLSIPYILWLDRYLVEPRDGAWHLGAMLIGREPSAPAMIWHHARVWAVKGFFTAFMLSIVPPGFSDLVARDWSAAATRPVELSGLLILLMFVIDEQIGTVGYIVTFRPLDAQIRSANPHLAGWLAALLCYPPFQLMQGGGPLNYQVNTADWAYWFEGRGLLLWLWAALLVVLTTIYAWATLAFGLRFSNLSYRGVLTNGPYRWTRHPAYLAKNCFWWLSTLPFLVTSRSLTDAMRNTVMLAAVSAIYFWRAKTEERHLLAEDPKYRAYYAWMVKHGPVTGAMVRIGRLLRPARGMVQPAE